MGEHQLPEGVARMLQNTEALFVNGFAFDELPAATLLAAAATARQSGAAVFFDPGGVCCTRGAARCAIVVRLRDAGFS